MAKASVKVVIDNLALAEFLETNPAIKQEMLSVGQAVAAEAQATASDAENGGGGRIDGYAAAGFSAVWNPRGGKRPRVDIISHAPIETFLAAHFHTQKRDGVAHLRAALYKFTHRG
jgi:hypothetical protein